MPNIRNSHVIRGRIPSAIGKTGQGAIGAIENHLL